MPIPRILRRRAQLALLALAALAPLGATAQTPAWPARPVTFVVSFPAGGPTDIVARAVAQQMAATLGQPVLVDNKPGAGGNLGGALVARATPDGYTLLVAAASLVTSPHLYKLSYDPLKDLTAVALLATAPVFIWVDAASPVRSVADLVAQVKARPGQYNYSSSAPATLAHLGSLRFFEAAGVQPTHVNYKGSAQAINDFLGGVFPTYFEVAQPVVPHLKAGKVRALAVVADKRSAFMPEVPSLAEAGYPGIEAVAFIDVMAPAGTPAAVVARLNEHARRALQAPEVRAKLSALYFDVSDGGEPAALTAWLKAESARWGDVIRRNGLKVD